MLCIEGPHEKKHSVGAVAAKNEGNMSCISKIEEFTVARFVNVF